MMSINKFHCNKKFQWESVLLIYIWCIGLFAIGLFLYGFFPIKQHNIPVATVNDIPKSINNIKVNSDHLYKPVVHKVIFMVIDALRWDFIKDAHELDVMPFTRGSIVNNSACLLQVKVNAPTVTMPRIKAMTSGAVSSFIDVALNFGKTTVNSDTVLLQAKKHGHKIIFYGDDTWLKLFPNMFQRFEGTTSFFVSDYTEVDLNVTRHIKNQLDTHDWSIMILHYLGLDHIGHVYGPKSPLVKPKLDEMDKVIREIALKVQQWNDNGVPSLLIVCGDHGMKNSGGHGGATLEETLVPLVAFGNNCNNINDNDDDDDSVQIDQVDIATTLSVMLGLPIPSSSIGSVSLNMINNLSSSNKLFTLYYNAKCVFSHFKELSSYQTRSGYTNYLKAIQMHTEWLNGSKNSLKEINAIINQYKFTLDEMKDLLVQSMIHYNVTIMSVAVILMSHVLIIILTCDIYNNFSLRKFIYCWILSVGLWLLLNLIFYIEDNDECFTMIDKRLAAIIIIVFTANCYWCGKISWSFLINIPRIHSNGMNLFLLTFFLYIVSLSSTSFIEEEHQTWYFFWSTFLTYQLFICIQKFHLIYLRKDDKINSVVKNIGKIIFVLVVHRVLRQLNSTGDAYAHLPDIKLWLKEDNSNIAMSLLVIIALGLLVTIGLIFTDSKLRKITSIFYSITSSCIYLRHVSHNSVIRPFFYPQSSGVHEVQIFWIAIVVFIVYSFVHANYYSSKNNTQRLFIIIQLLVMISALLHRSHNLILLPMQLITCIIIQNLLKSSRSEITDLYVSYCLGNVFYFYQGNSNSLATVDVAAGYVGLQSFILPVTTLFLCINTYSAPILVYLILLYGKIRQKMYHSIDEKIFLVNRQLSFFKFLSITAYTIIITISRYHLFIWSVFSPKLLYEAMYSMVLFVTMFAMQTFFSLSKIINNK